MWYNTSTMPHPTPIDISNMPELVRIAEEVEATKTPRELKRQNKTVAVIMPATPATPSKTHTWEQTQKTFGSWNDVDADAMIATIYRWRSVGSRPVTRPS